MLIKNLHNYLTNVRGAIHVGGHFGEEASWYHENGFTRVLWFEPCFSSYEVLVRNIEAYPNQKAFQFGIHDTLTNAVLHIASNAGESSSILQLGKHKIYHPEVRYVGQEEILLHRLDWVFNAFKIDIKDFNFLNVDVQGAELNVIRSFGEGITGMNYIYTEVNVEELYEGCSLIHEVDEYLSKFAFKRVLTEMTKANWGDALYVKEEKDE